MANFDVDLTDVASETALNAHVANTSNPHSVTKSQVGLGNVDNTSDANKPISTATQTALDGKVDENAAITGATKTKITYDAKGLVTAGADATTADVSDSTNKRYVTDAQLTVIGNTSGTNTGDAITRVLANAAITLTNQPNSLEILTTALPGLFISRVDLTNFTQVMLQVHVFTASGSGNSPRVILGYSSTYTVVPGSYSDIGTTAVTCSMSSTGIIQSGWVNIVAGAKADIYITGLTNGGNGTADPVIQGVTAFFR